jgi:hypothetical protein
MVWWVGSSEVNRLVFLVVSEKLTRDDTNPTRSQISRS